MLFQDSKVPRERLFLTSKLWPVDYGFTEAQEECRRSCERLDTEYLGKNIVIIHYSSQEKMILVKFYYYILNSMVCYIIIDLSRIYSVTLVKHGYFEQCWLLLIICK